MLRLVLLCCVAMVITMGDTVNEKRLVLHSDEDVAAAFHTMASQFRSLNETVQDLKNTVQYKESTIETLQITVLLLHSAIQSKDATVTSLNASLQSLKSTVDSRESEIQTLETSAQRRETTIQFLQSTVLSMQSTLQSLPTTGQSSTYTRWGRTGCPANGTELVYKGYVGGSRYTVPGAAADYLCLTDEPLWGYYDDAASSIGLKIYGTEYQFGQQFTNGGEALFGQNMFNHDAPCAVCRVPRATTIMIPGRNRCYAGWSTEYSGYLVAGHSGNQAASNYACLDSRPETEVGDSASQDGKLMWVTEAKCGSLKCPPYVDNREITCVVCSI